MRLRGMHDSVIATAPLVTFYRADALHCPRLAVGSHERQHGSPGQRPGVVAGRSGRRLLPARGSSAGGAKVILCGLYACTIRVGRRARSGRRLFEGDRRRR
jgi:hypothetical protein